MQHLKKGCLFPMKGLLLFVSLLFALLFPVQSGKTAAATCWTATPILLQETAYLPTADASYHGGEITPTELKMPTGSMVAGTVIPVPVQQRHYSARPSFRTPSHLPAVRNPLRALTLYMEAQSHQRCRTYTTLKIPCWQYAADNYIFAYRHIII